MARGDSLARQLQLFMLLDAEREVSVDGAAARLNCARRTVYRDFEVLQRVGMPLYQEQQGRRARWRLDEGFRRRLSVALSHGEVLALLAGAQALETLEGTVFHQSAARALDKLKAALAPEVRKRVEAVAGRVSVRAGGRRDYADRRAALDALMEAVEQQETVELAYRKLKAKRVERYTLEPHHLHLHSGAVYVIGWVREREAARVFLLDRVAEVKKTGAGFERRVGLDGKGLVHGHFGVWSGPVKKVALRLTGNAARIVAESVLHPSQVNQWRSGGELDVTLEVPLSPALVAWVRGWGKEVTVVGPRELGKMV